MRNHSLSLLLVIVLISTSCERKKPAAKEELQRIDPAASDGVTLDHLTRAPVSSTQTVLRKTFTLSATANFPFEVPAQAVQARLHGNYKSFVTQVGIQASDDSANVEFMILTEDQFAAFSHGRAGEALFSADASHDQDVNVSLPPSQDQPRKYYLVFRNTPGQAKKLVQADFTADF